MYGELDSIKLAVKVKMAGRSIVELVTGDVVYVRYFNDDRLTLASYGEGLDCLGKIVCLEKDHMVVDCSHLFEESVKEIKYGNITHIKKADKEAIDFAIKEGEKYL